jgi:positive regulator of sigma E activity
MNLRLILWIPVMAYVGFLWTGQGSRSVNSETITGALIGALLGFCVAFIFSRRQRRKQSAASSVQR